MNNQRTESSFEVIFDENTCPSKVAHEQLKCSQIVYPFARSQVATIQMKDATVIYAQENDDKQILECIFDCSKLTDWDIAPGDSIAILPHNSDRDVQMLLQIMKLEDKADHSCHIQVDAKCLKKSLKVPQYIPKATTPRNLLRDCINLRAVLKKQFLRALANCCANKEDHNFLLRLSSKEASQQYNELVLQESKTLLDLLQLCSSCTPTLAMLIEHLPRLLPRPYSVANSTLANPSEIKIIFSILKQGAGVTTNMLKQLAENYLHAKPRTEQTFHVSLYLRNAHRFRYTSAEAKQNNQILITIGCGLSPFLAFLEYKNYLMQQTDALSETWLFVGAKNENALLYRDNLLEWRMQGVLNKYFECFSQDTTAPYNYVQDVLSANSAEFVEYLLQPNTLLYLCADGAQISKSIESAIGACLQEQLKIDEIAVGKLIKDFRESGKYIEELWT